MGRADQRQHDQLWGQGRRAGRHVQPDAMPPATISAISTGCTSASLDDLVRSDPVFVQPTHLVGGSVTAVAGDDCEGQACARSGKRHGSGPAARSSNAISSLLREHAYAASTRESSYGRRIGEGPAAKVPMPGAEGVATVCFGEGVLEGWR